MTAIRRLEITAFGKFRNHEISFSDGCNEIERENESGKSTTVDFIVFMLYGFKKSNSKSKQLGENLLKKYMPWNGEGMISGAMILETDNGTRRIERSQRESGREAMTVRDASGAPVAVTEPGLTFFGVDRDTFLRTFLVRQTDTVFSGCDGIRTALTNLVTTGDEETSFDDAMEILRKKKAKYQHGDRRSGRIFDIPKELTLLEGEHLEIRSELNGLCDSKRELAELTGHINALENEGKRLNALMPLAAASDARIRVGRLDELDARIDECKKLITNADNGADFESAVAAAFSKRNALDEKRNMLSADNENAEKELARIMEKCPYYESVKQNEETFRRISEEKEKLNPAVLSVGTLALIAGIALVIADNPVIGAIIALAGLITAVMSFVFKKKIKVPSQLSMSAGEAKNAYALFCSVRTDAELAYAALKRSAGALDALAPEIKSNTAECAKYAEMGIADADALSEYIAKKRTTELAVRQLSELQDRRNALLGNDSYEALLESSGEICEYTVSRLTDELNVVIGEKNTAVSRAQAIDSDVKRAYSLENRLTEICAETDALNDELASAQYENDVLAIASDALSAAYEKLNSVFSPRLTELAREPLTALTDGRYTEAVLDRDFNIRVKAEGAMRELDYFSRGTMDAVYLALRLAVSELISGNANLPVILDDPFWSLDTCRRSKAMEFAQKLATNRQIIIFSAR